MSLKKDGPPCYTCRPRVLRDNVETERVYERCQAQWIISPMGRLVAIYSQSIEAVMNICQIPRDDRRDVLDGVNVIAGRVAQVINRKADE